MALSDRGNGRIKQLGIDGGWTGFAEDLSGFDRATSALAAQAQSLPQLAIAGEAVGHSVTDLRVGDAFAETDVHEPGPVRLLTVKK